MPLYKTSKADLRGKYKHNLEISIIVSLIFLIAAFKFSPQKSNGETVIKPVTDIISVIDVQPTKQNQTPPKIKPVVPEISINPEIKEIEFEATDLNVNENVEKPPERTEVYKIIADENVIFKVVEQLPKPIGGIEAIQNKIHYTEIAKRVGIEGKVIILAIVGKNGDVISASITKSLFPSLDEVALNAVKSTKFIPGKQRGKPVNVQMYIPIFFKLQ